jgi:FkbM family methyltransferase
MKDLMIRFICVVAHSYLRSTTFVTGKQFIWDHVLRPFVLWRTLPIVAVTRFGATIEGSLPDVIHSYLYFFGVWEPGITRIYRHHLRPGDVCIDIGANVGAHTLLAAELVGGRGRVHAIEASPTIFHYLKRNLQLNECQHVVPYNIAVTNATGPVTIFLHDAGNLGGTTIMVGESRNRPTTREIVIDGSPLSGILPVEEIAAARLIKIDVEGAEWLVLQGMRDILPILRHDCLILIEISKEALAADGVHIDDVISLLGQYDRHPFEILNAYSPDQYFKPPGQTRTSAIRRDAPLLDLGFARRDVCDALLQADATRSGWE